MKTIIQEPQQAARTAANSPDQVEAAAQAELNRLAPDQQETVRLAMQNHPGVSLAETLEMLNAFGL